MLDISTTLDIIYYIIIGVNFIVSIVVKKLWKHLYFIYFFVTLLREKLVLISGYYKLYNFLDLFCIVFFWSVLEPELKNKRILNFISIVLLFLSVYYIRVSGNPYSIYTGISYCIYLILITLLWFYEKISYENSYIPIFEYQFFWIGSSLLLWAVFYLFRMTPMYYIQTEDEKFLYFLKYIFQVATNGAYLLFLKGLLSKK